MSIGPCVYPGCRDLDGNPRLTRDTICEQSRFHYRRTLDRLVEHWVLLRELMPQPTSTGLQVVVSRGEKIFGHPAEWASDSAAAIVRQFGDSHAGLAEQLGHDVVIPPDHAAEEVRLKAAHAYVANWFDELCRYDYAAVDAEEYARLNRSILTGLGHTDRKERVSGVPCPSCDMLTLARIVTVDGERSVECQSCGALPAADYQAWLTATTEKIFDDLGDAA